MTSIPDARPCRLGLEPETEAGRACDANQWARRQDRLHWAAATWEALPFDAEAARMYGRVFAAVKGAERTSRSRLADLLIASTAAANGLPLYTRNPADFAGLDVIAV